MELHELDIESRLHELRKTRTFRVIKFSETVKEDWAVYLTENNQGVIMEDGELKPYKHVTDGMVKGRPDEVDEKFKQNLKNFIADGEFYEEAV